MTKELRWKIEEAMTWRTKIGSGEITGNDATHMKYSSVSQKELTKICSVVNAEFKLHKSSLRIGNFMGELIPYKK